MRDKLDLSSSVLWVLIDGKLTEAQRTENPARYFRYIPPTDGRFLGEQYAFNLSDIISNEVLQLNFADYISNLKKMFSVKVSVDIPLGILSEAPMKSYTSTSDEWKKLSAVCDEVNISIYIEDDEV